MKLSKFLFGITFVTFFSLVYVYQQSEIFRLAYVGQKKLYAFEELLDKNTVLRYNIAKGASLVRIGNKISNNADFQMPDTYRLVKLTSPLGGLKANQYLPKKETLFARIFGIKTVAQAETISPSTLLSPSANSGSFEGY